MGVIEIPQEDREADGLERLEIFRVIQGIDRGLCVVSLIPWVGALFFGKTW